MSQLDDISATERSGRVATDEIPNPETGVGIGARNEPDTFEPEEDPE